MENTMILNRGESKKRRRGDEAVGGNESCVNEKNMRMERER
jgi:hypothetical protein